MTIPSELRELLEVKREQKPRVRCVDGKCVPVAKPPRYCAADRDGDCCHPGCPQRVDWQSSCPIPDEEEEA